MNSTIKYYPVDNGDQTLISVVEDGNLTNILVDSNIRDSCKDGKNSEQYDVKSDLVKSLNLRTVNDVKNVPYLDVFILTHGDDDHLHGFECNFYQGDPKNYSKKNLENGEILIDVMWFSPMVMGTATNDDERCFNKEAKRRIKLHRDNSPEKDNAGNRIVIIGYDGNEKLDDLDLVRKVPGNIVTRFNDRDLSTFSIFIHSPYHQHLTDEEVDKNRVSVVFQARFKANRFSSEFCTLAMFGGDADHITIGEIIDKTKRYGNDKKEQALNWDLFIACHHCSWTFFNKCKYEDNPTPVKTSLEFLDYRRGSAKIIASCKKIEDNEDNPPHYPAKEQYVSKVGEKNFLNTATTIIIGKTPQPIVFEITGNGPVLQKKTEGAAQVAGTALLNAVSSPSTYGSTTV